MVWVAKITWNNKVTIIAISGIKHLGELGIFAASGPKLIIEGFDRYGGILETETAAPADWVQFCNEKKYTLEVLEGTEIPEEPAIADGVSR